MHILPWMRLAACVNRCEQLFKRAQKQGRHRTTTVQSWVHSIGFPRLSQDFTEHSTLHPQTQSMWSFRSGRWLESWSDIFDTWSMFLRKLYQKSHWWRTAAAAIIFISAFARIPRGARPLALRGEDTLFQCFRCFGKNRIERAEKNLYNLIVNFGGVITFRQTCDEDQDQESRLVRIEIGSPE